MRFDSYYFLLRQAGVEGDRKQQKSQVRTGEFPERNIAIRERNGQTEVENDIHGTGYKERGVS